MRTTAAAKKKKKKKNTLAHAASEKDLPRA